VTKKAKLAFGKWRKQPKASDKRRQNDQPGPRRREFRPSQKGSGDATDRMDFALLCARAGLPIVPLHGVKGGLCTCPNEHCEQPGRHPRVKHPTANRALIKKYWTKWPKAKIGVVLGAESGVLALLAEGPAGKKTLRALEEKTQ
jgi:hypothetical protein